MRTFSTIKAAKNYLADRIAEEALREGVPLTETERKMLYFSETGWTLPDMQEISADFDRDYDQNAYEQKIGGLIHAITEQGQSQSRANAEDWDGAVEKLAEGDHYLSVLVSVVPDKEAGLHGFLPTSDRSSVRPPHDRLKLWISAIVLVIGPILFIGLMNHLFGQRFWDVCERLFGEGRGKLWVLGGVVAWLLWTGRTDLKLILRGLTRQRKN
jgi:hypothetical protein